MEMLVPWKSMRVSPKVSVPDPHKPTQRLLAFGRGCAKVGESIESLT